MKERHVRGYQSLLVGGLSIALVIQGWTAEQSSIANQLEQLKQQNEQLKQQLQSQQQLIDSLSQKVNGFQQTDTERSRQIADLKTAINDKAVPEAEPPKAAIGSKIQLSGQVAAAFYSSGSEGQSPHSEFRLDDARLFLEAQVWKDVYAYTEITLVTHEAGDENLHLGEVYIDLENILGGKIPEGLLNLRLGRFYIPYGEEYAVRYPADNPLISHSLGDFWGIDEGIELYGKLGRFSYAAAVQNGGVSTISDFTADKSIALRVGYDPTRNWHFSLSAMRTGDLDASDELSEMWIGNALFRPLGAPETTTKFHANLIEGDAEWRFKRGHLKAAGGYVQFDDDDTSARNDRDIYYYFVEGLWNFTEKFYAASRFSQIFAQDGFPIVGQGNFEKYFFDVLTEDIWRLSLGVGYRLNPNLTVKAEYSFERGKTVSGESRNHEDLVAAQIETKF